VPPSVHLRGRLFFLRTIERKETGMRHNKLALYLHLVWATWDRLPSISPGMERGLQRLIESRFQDMGCKVLALNTLPEHVHTLVSFPTTITIAEMVKQVKGNSSKFINDTWQPSAPFKWQGSYGAFTVSRWDIDQILNYVRNQKDHHHTGELTLEWEETYEEGLAS
jgi:putative transposase